MSNIGMAEKIIEAYYVFYNARKRKEELVRRTSMYDQNHSIIKTMII